MDPAGAFINDGFSRRLHDTIDRYNGRQQAPQAPSFDLMDFTDLIDFIDF